MQQLRFQDETFSRKGDMKLILDQPHAKQIGVIESPSRFKVVRAGRRWGKTTAASVCAVVGHGPRVGDQPLWKGMVQGRDVIWVVQDYPQSENFWFEFVEPTFGKIAQCNRTDRTVTLAGRRLWIKSSENIESALGLGKNLGGVIFEEAAQYDTLDVFRRVIRPMLMDNQGWAIWISNTKAGSEFNLVCEDVMVGKRSPEEGWEHWHFTSYDNPLIPASEIDALVGEYPQGSQDLQEQIFAELLAGGAGLAFPEWRPDVHVRRVEPLPSDWECTAGLDWGYHEEGGYVTALHGPGGRFHVASEIAFRGKTGEQLGEMLGQSMTQTGVIPMYVAYDSQMDADGPTLIEEVAKGMQMVLGGGVRVPLVSVPKGPGSRIHSKGLLHELLRYKADDEGKVHQWGMSRFSLDAVRCPRLALELPKLPRDERKIEDVDTHCGFDHLYDALRYILLARVPTLDGTTKPHDIPNQIHPGFIPGTFERRDRVRNRLTEARELKISLEARGLLKHPRYSRPRT